MNLSGITSDQCKFLLGHSDPELVAYRGSIAHGTYVPQNNTESDKDLIFTYVAPLDKYIGCKSPSNDSRYDDSIERKLGVWDSVGYDIRKLFRMLSNANPNVMELLWVSDSNVIHQTDIGFELRENRHVFSSKRYYHSYIGFARSQMKLMAENPSKTNLGENRRAIIDKHGYDTKASAHTIRLLSMIIEFLSEGVLKVERSDSQKLISIRKGHWTQDRVIAEATRLFALADLAYVKSDLPSEPNSTTINNLCVKLIAMKHKIGGCGV